MTRHLVWTLVDPAAALSECFRVLARGRLVIEDGDFVSRGCIGWLYRSLFVLPGS